jgi:hypothetical protein
MWNLLRTIVTRRSTPPDAPLPDVLARALRHTSFDPNATRSAELFSGGFMYSDEMPARWCFDPDDGKYAFRLLIAFRASLIRGEPVEDLRPIWQEIHPLCPHWPGFRLERCDPALREELKRELRRTCRSVVRALRQVRKESPGTASAE